LASGPNEDFWPFSIIKSKGFVLRRPGEVNCVSTFYFNGIFGGFGWDEYIIYVTFLAFYVIYKIFID